MGWSDRKNGKFFEVSARDFPSSEERFFWGEGVGDTHIVAIIITVLGRSPTQHLVRGITPNAGKSICEGTARRDHRRRCRCRDDRPRDACAGSSLCTAARDLVIATLDRYIICMSRQCSFMLGVPLLSSTAVTAATAATRVPTLVRRKFIICRDCIPVLDAVHWIKPLLNRILISISHVGEPSSTDDNRCANRIPVQSRTIHLWFGRSMKVEIKTR